MALSKSLGAGMKYHCSILYNFFDGPPSGRQGDCLLSWNFLKKLEEKLIKEGCEQDKIMYHDKARPGSNVFDNADDMIVKSDKIVVLLTPGFVFNVWVKYTEQAAIKDLLDREEANTRIIPIAINLSPANIPKNLGLTVSHVIYTDYQNTVDEVVWGKILKAMELREVSGEDEVDEFEVLK